MLKRSEIAKFGLLLGALVLSGTAFSNPKTVTLGVPGMNCAACPITIKKALTKVSGVSKIDVSLDRREARVTFDDAKANVEALSRATKDAGFPSTLVGAAK